MTLSFSTALVSLAADKGIDNDGWDLAYSLSMGAALSRRLRLDFAYQFSSVPMRSPDPLGDGDIASKFFMHNEMILLNYRYDAFAWVPFASMGLGLYHMSAVNSQTGLDFSIGVQLPLRVGVQGYLYRDELSMSLAYQYQILFDEEQSPGVLSLLGLNEISFDVQNIILEITWHLF